MSKKEFLLFLNANGIPYKVCKMLQGKIREIELSSHVDYAVATAWYQHRNSAVLILITSFIENEIIAKKFNLSSYEYWSPHLELTAMEMNDLQHLLGM